MRTTHLTCPKCGREFDVEVESYPVLSRAGIQTTQIVGISVVYDDHRLAVHPTWFFGYKISCPYCGKTSKFNF